MSVPDKAVKSHLSQLLDPVPWLGLKKVETYGFEAAAVSAAVSGRVWKLFSSASSSSPALSFLTFLSFDHMSTDGTKSALAWLTAGTSAVVCLGIAQTEVVR